MGDYRIEQFSNKCRKTETKIIALKTVTTGTIKQNEPIRNLSKYN